MHGAPPMRAPAAPVRHTTNLPSSPHQVAALEVAAPGASYAPGGLPPPSAHPRGNRFLASLRACFCLPPRAPPSPAPSDAASDLLPPAPPRAPLYVGEPVLGPRGAQDAGRKTLVLDLDETLVHSSFRPVPDADFVIPVDIDGRVVDVYVLKRPHVDEFLAQVGARFEVVVFTASLAKYADPLLDLLDPRNTVRWRLFRDACVPFEGNYVKDLQCLGRPLEDSVIVDNSPHSYAFQPDNAVPVSTFIDDPTDTELLQILPVLLAVERVADVRPHLAHHVARLAEAQASRAQLGRERQAGKKIVCS